MRNGSVRALTLRLAVLGAAIGWAACPIQLARGDAKQPRSATAHRYFLYVSVGGEKRIAIYEMDPETGKLTSKGSVDAGGDPGSLAIDPTHTFLYAGIRSIKGVSTFRMNADDGGLAPLGTVPLVNNPVYVSTDRNGKFLFMCCYEGDTAAVYPIDADGTVNPTATQVIKTPRKPHSILVDRANAFVLMPTLGTDAVQQFRFDAAKGMLTPNDPPTASVPSGAGPRHFVFHPQRNDLVYVINELGSSVTPFRLDPAAGTLTALETVSTLPKDFQGKNTCADVEVTPSGKFLYGSNRGHDSIAGFSIDATTGLLTPIGHVPTEKMPREFNIDPTGRYLYAAGQATRNMAAYRIDQETGRLSPMDVYDVGQGPAWVLVVKQPAR